MDKKTNKLENVNGGARFGLLDMLYFVIWFGILTGLAEIVLPQMNALIKGRTVFLRYHRLWMSPLASVAVIGFAGLAVLPLIMRRSRPIAVRIAFIVLTSVLFLNVLVLEFQRLSRIHFASKVVLAIGLAVVMQRFIARRTSGFERFVRRTTIILAMLVLIFAVTAVGSNYFKHFQEQKVVAALPNPPESSPNVLLIVLDTVRAESMSLYGYERATTPFLKSIAEQGIVFQYTIAPCSWTLPTYASMYTGRFLYETGVDFTTPLDSTYPTLAEFLSEHGYVTAGFMANNTYCKAERGIARGFIHYEDQYTLLGRIGYSSSLFRFALKKSWFRHLIGYHDWPGRKSADQITDDFLRWLDNAQNSRQFFVSLNYFDAHQPYLPPKEFKKMFGPTDRLDEYLERYLHGGNCSLSNTSREEIQSIRNAYDGAIAYLDYSLKRLFDELSQRDILDRTLVIIVSDHGEEFGEHVIFGHGSDLHIQSIRVPLMLRLPDIVPVEVTVTEPVTLRDIPATVIKLLELPDNGLFPSLSLSRHWINSDNEEMKADEFILSETNHSPWKPEWVPCNKGPMKSLIIGYMHYIRNGDGSEEVYDLRNDPEEQNDLIQTPRGADAAAQARDILKQMIP